MSTPDKAKKFKVLFWKNNRVVSRGGYFYIRVVVFLENGSFCSHGMAKKMELPDSDMMTWCYPCHDFVDEPC